METVLVTGGTGHLGRHIVALLKQSYRVRVLTRTSGTDPEVEWAVGDLATGVGLSEAVRGADVIVHAATYSPAARRGYLLPQDLRRSPPDVDVDGTARLLEDAVSSGVRHLIYVSITGVDQPHGAYLRLKHSAEELVSTGEVPWSIVRATQFYWLLDRMLSQLARLRVLPMPSGVRAQPTDAADFAQYVVECVDQGPGQRKPDFGGPETRSVLDLTRQWQRERGRSARAFSFPLPRGAQNAASRLMNAAHGRHGTKTWSEWLRENPPE